MEGKHHLLLLRSLIRSLTISLAQIPRTMKWMKGKVTGGGQMAKDVFSHHDGNTGIETEA
jgi:hypothetical protein